jgi:hypothetical protein
VIEGVDPGIEAAMDPTQSGGKVKVPLSHTPNTRNKP